MHLDITKNMQYDRQTAMIMKKVLTPESNAIDVGCHKGEIMKEIVKLAPLGRHYGFEPIPALYQKIRNVFDDGVYLFDYALSDRNGFSEFNYVLNAPAFSGLRQRTYHISNPEITKIRVELKKLDDIVPADTRIDFIKIDVEGGEFDVLKGSKKLLLANKPIIIFEFGLGASEYYNSTPGELYDFLSNTIGLNISLMIDFIEMRKPLIKDEFETLYFSKKEYYFIAHPG